VYLFIFYVHLSLTTDKLNECEHNSSKYAAQSALIIHSLIPSLIHSFIPFRNDLLLLLLACRLMDLQAQPKAMAMEWNVSATARELGIYLDPPPPPYLNRSTSSPLTKRHIT